MYCPQCRKIKLELFEEATDENEGDRFTCSTCGIFVDIKPIHDKDVLTMIGYENDEEDE